MNGTTSLAEIRRRGIDALLRELGLVGMAKYLQDREVGSGDYAKDREQWQKGKSVRGIVREINKKKRRRL